MKGTMLAAMFYEPGDLRIEEVPIPELEDDGILLRIGAATTCGTDAKIYQRGYPELPSLPMPFGHECAGVVAAVGKDVRNVEVGERIVAGIASYCGECYWCKRNEHVFCINRRYCIPGGAMAGGAYAEYIAIHGGIVANNIHRIPEHVSFGEAAMVEPLACALYGIEDLPEIRIGDTVVVLGDGPIGQFFLCLAKLHGAQVIVCGSRHHRLEKAMQFGASATIDYHAVPDQIKAVYDLVGEPGPDVVIEATGLPESWELSVNMARRGGVVMLFGGCKGGSSVTLDTRKIHYDCLTIKSPSVYIQDADLMSRSLKLFASGEIPGKDFISGSYPLEDAVTGLKDYMLRKGLKFEIVPPAFWQG
jgi:L-iditol 2-dehydrogenase